MRDGLLSEMFTWCPRLGGFAGAREVGLHPAWCYGGLAAGSLLQGQMWDRLGGAEGYSLGEAGDLCRVAPCVLVAACGVLHMKKFWAIIAFSSCLVMSLLMYCFNSSEV